MGMRQTLGPRNAGRPLTLAFVLACWTPMASAGEVVVKIKGEIVNASLRMYFEPETVTVPAGTTIVWVNEDHDDHIIQFADGSSPRLRSHANNKPDAQHSQTFSQPGTFPYQCAIHRESMRGTVIVE